LQNKAVDVCRSGPRVSSFADALYDDALEEEEVDDYYPETYVRPKPKIGRNEPCPCARDNKYWKCRGTSESETAH